MQQQQKRQLSLATALSLLLGGLALAPSAQATSLLDETFDSTDGGLNVVNGIEGANSPPPGQGWVYNSSLGTWSVNGAEGVVNSGLNTPAVVITTAGDIILTFSHRYDFEHYEGTRWDGGVLRVSINGAPYTYVPASQITGNGYQTDQPIGGNSPPLNGLYGFNDTSPGFLSGDFVQSQASLGNLNSGDTVSVQFLGAWDEGFVQPPNPDWEINWLAISSSSVATIPDGLNTLMALGFVFIAIGLGQRVLGKIQATSPARIHRQPAPGRTSGRRGVD